MSLEDYFDEIKDADYIIGIDTTIIYMRRDREKGAKGTRSVRYVPDETGRKFTDGELRMIAQYHWDQIPQRIVDMVHELDEKGSVRENTDYTVKKLKCDE